MEIFSNQPDEKEAINDIISSFLRFAYKDSAGAILFELTRDKCPVYFLVREDKKLHSELPLYIHAPIVNRIREMAGLIPSSSDATEEAGFVQVRMTDPKHGLHMNYDLLVNITPTSTGSRLLITIQQTD